MPQRFQLQWITRKFRTNEHTAHKKILQKGPKGLKNMRDKKCDLFPILSYTLLRSINVVHFERLFRSF